MVVFRCNYPAHCAGLVQEPAENLKQIQEIMSALPRVPRRKDPLRPGPLPSRFVHHWKSVLPPQEEAGDSEEL